MTDQHDESEQVETFTAEQMSEVRNEAKTWRKKLRDAEAELTQLREQVATITSERDHAIEERDTITGERDALKAAGELAELTNEIARKNGIPVEALRGSTREELEAHAEVLKPVYTKAHGVFVPTIGDTPGNTNDSLAEFAADLFNNE